MILLSDWLPSLWWCGHFFGKADIKGFFFAFHDDYHDLVNSPAPKSFFLGEYSNRGWWAG